MKHGAQFVAWYEPEHHIVEATAEFFRAPLRRPALGDPDARAICLLGRQANYALAMAFRVPKHQATMRSKTYGARITRRLSIPRGST